GVSKSEAVGDIQLPGIRLATELHARDELFRLAFSPTGSCLAATRKGAPYVWDLESGQLLNMPGFAWSNDLDWSEEGTRLAVPGAGSSTAIYTIASGRRTATPNLEPPDQIQAIRWLPHQDAVAVGLSSGELKLVHLTSSDTQSVGLGAHEQSVCGLAVV